MEFRISFCGCGWSASLRQSRASQIGSVAGSSRVSKSSRSSKASSVIDGSENLKLTIEIIELDFTVTEPSISSVKTNVTGAI